MKSKSIVILIIITSVLLISNITSPITDENKVISKNQTAKEDLLKTATATNDDSISSAEDIAQCLRNAWLLNRLNQSGSIILGQEGVSGVGEFFLELHKKKTDDVTYLRWATDIASWLINNHPASYPSGKWPNKMGSSGIANYSGYMYGSAGIGSFFLNLFEETGNISYSDQATYVKNYLNPLGKLTPTGKVWQEMDPIILNNAVINPGSRQSIKGTTTTPVENLDSYDKIYYNITDQNLISSFNFLSYVSESGLPNMLSEDWAIIDDYVTGFTVKISAKSNVTLASSLIQIYSYDNTSWVNISVNGIETNEHTFSKTVTSNMKSFIQDTTIMMVRVNATSSGAHKILLDALNTSLNFNYRYNSSSYGVGAAGIGDFYLNCYQKLFPTVPDDLIQAKLAANYTIEKAITIGGNSSWLEKGAYFTGNKIGTAGIGKFLLELHQETSEQKYLDYAKNAANWLIKSSVKQQISGLTTARWGTTNISTTVYYYTGIDYCAGIGQFLLKLGQEITGADIYFNNSVFSANWLTSLSNVVEREQLYDYQYPIYKWRQYMQTGPIDDTYSKGGAGALEFLNDVFLATNNARFSEYVSRGLEWLIRDVNTNFDIWEVNLVKMYLSDGVAGLGYALLKISLMRPEIYSGSNPGVLEYDSTLILTFTILNYSSNLQDVLIQFKAGTLFYDSDQLTHVSGTLYSYTFNTISYNTTIQYSIIAIDNNNSLILDDNHGEEYTLEVVDTKAPDTTLTPLYGDGLGASDSGILRIEVKKENIRGAQFTYVEVLISDPNFALHSLVYLNEFTLVSSTYIFDFEIETPSDVNYGDEITINVFTWDNASNHRITLETLRIIDNYNPYCNVEEDFRLEGYTSWVPQMTDVPVVAKVTDVGSGLDEEQGVFVLYTTDDGANWKTAYLEETSDNEYEGVIPGQLALVQVYYVLGAEDKAGNYILWDKYGTDYDDIENIELNEMFSYSIIVNLLMVAIIAGIIAAIAIVGYLIYSKRGGYLDKMRRKSRAAASGLVIKEKLTNMYYWMSEKINKLGEKLVKSKGGFSKAGFWLADHFGEGTEKALKKTGRVLWAVPKGIGNSIRYFFVGIGRLITKSKGWQIFVYLIFGVVILLSTMLQFIMEGYTPLRGVFFVNLGFFMVITGIVTFLIRFVYKLAYK